MVRRKGVLPDGTGDGVMRRTGPAAAARGGGLTAVVAPVRAGGADSGRPGLAGLPDPWGRPRRRRGRREVLRGVVSLAGLLAMVAGMPPLLVICAPVGLHVPSWGEAAAALMRPDDGTLLLALVYLVAWACWGILGLGVLLDALARVRHVPAVRVPGLGGVQQPIAVLVAAVSVLLAPATATVVAPVAVSTLSASAHPGPPPASTPPTPPNPHPGAAPAATTAASAGSVEGSSVTVRVRPGETLWSLAERHLGDGARYQEIADLNYGRRQSDGHALTDAHWLRPGWILRLPADATPAAAAAHVVVAGDTLRGIAAARLGDPDRAGDIYALNVGRLQPDGAALTDPDLLRPG